VIRLTERDQTLIRFMVEGLRVEGLRVEG
jgi:hypothetical protein